MDKTEKQMVIDGFEASGLSYGDIINHSDVDGWSNIEFPDLSGVSGDEQRKLITKFQLDKLGVMDALRDHLLTERMMYLESISGTGYRIVEPAQQTEAAVRKGIRQIQNGLRHATKGVEQVNTAMLDTREREYNASVKARLSGLARMIGKKRDYIGID